MNREHADPNEPWNPRQPVEITLEEYEKQVLAWVKSHPEASLSKITHRATVTGEGGHYTIDIRVRMTLLGGAILDLFIECKHQTRKVERDEVMILEGKLRDVGAHKGMLFSTSGFQKGAIKYATARGIAAMTMTGGDWHYITKAEGPTPPPPPWLHVSKFAAVRVTFTEDGGIMSHLFDSDHLDALSEFLGEQNSSAD